MDSYQQYEDWWKTLDRNARRRFDAELSLGIPDDLADGMEAAGIKLPLGVVADAGGVKRVRMSPPWLRLFIESQGDDSSG